MFIDFCDVATHELKKAPLPEIESSKDTDKLICGNDFCPNFKICKQKAKAKVELILWIVLISQK